jgi:hypothetical protein
VPVEGDCVYPSVEDIAYGIGEVLAGYDGCDEEFVMAGHLSVVLCILSILIRYAATCNCAAPSLTMFLILKPTCSCGLIILDNSNFYSYPISI